MTKTVNWQDIKEMHKEKFGFYPVITGGLFLVIGFPFGAHIGRNRQRGAIY